MPSLSARLECFTESVIRRMTRTANAYGAINLSQGFPDFDPPAELAAALERAALKGPHQYAVTWGAPNFREALARKQSRFMGLPIDPDTQIVVTCGSTEAMMTAMMTVCNPGDTVVVFSPFYENYAADAILSGAEPIYVMVDISEFGCPDDNAFCEWMAREVGVAAVPGSSFFREDVRHLVRLHFAKNQDTLDAALGRLTSLRQKARKAWA
jgi:aspartate/methionine/tyrosine aminotransferase